MSQTSLFAFTIIHKHGAFLTHWQWCQRRQKWQEYILEWIRTFF